MIINVTEYFDFLDSAESYNQKVFVVDDMLFIPYGNLYVLKNNTVINKSDQNLFLNYSYLCFLGVSEFAWNFSKEGKSIFNNIKFKDGDDCSKVDYHAGGNVLSGHDGCEFRIKFKEMYLWLSKENSFWSLTSWGLDSKLQGENERVEASTIDMRTFSRKENIPYEILTFFAIDDANKIKEIDLSENLPLLEGEDVDLENNWLV